ncbi:MAG: ABC transporter permease [Nocardioides sp.]|uniref:ABC transporter permease n=1 Tax=Nocardioides sp. TaxID=35761 RepID=UPI0039E555F7
MSESASIPATPAPPPARVPGQPTFLQRQRGWILGTVAIIVVLAAWQVAVAQLHLASELVLPTPYNIGHRIAQLLVSSDFWYNMRVSGKGFAIGFGLAIVVGLLLGLLIGWFAAVQSMLDPFVHFLNSTPRIALAPLFVIWFGIGVWSKVAVIFFGAVFPIIITTTAGVKNLDPALLRAARAFGASNLQLFRTVALPGAVPYIISGLRMAVAHALTGVVVGEYIASNAGVGMMMMKASQVYDTPTVFAGVIIIAALGLAFTQAFAALEKRFQAWKPTTG